MMCVMMSSMFADGHITTHSIHVDPATSVAVNVDVVLGRCFEFGTEIAAEGLHIADKSAIIGKRQIQITGGGININGPGHIVYGNVAACRCRVAVQNVQCTIKGDIAGGGIKVQLAHSTVRDIASAGGTVKIKFTDADVADIHTGGCGFNFQRVAGPILRYADQKILAGVKADSEIHIGVIKFDNQLVP